MFIELHPVLLKTMDSTGERDHYMIYKETIFSIYSNRQQNDNIMSTNKTHKLST